MLREGIDLNEIQAAAARKFYVPKHGSSWPSAGLRSCLSSREFLAVVGGAANREGNIFAVIVTEPDDDTTVARPLMRVVVQFARAFWQLFIVIMTWLFCESMLQPLN